MESKINQTGTYRVRAIANTKFADSNVITLLSLNPVCRLEDLTPEPESFGIFEFMRNENNEMGAFLNSLLGENALNLENLVPIDMEYIYNHSGKKLVSTIVKTFVHRWNKTNFVQYPITVGNFRDLASIIRARYLTKWKKLWETISYDYDPYKPYNFEQNENTTKDHVHSKDDRSYGDQSGGKDYTYGYNDGSTDGSPTGRSESSAGGSSSLEHTRDAEYSRTVNRNGNIGNITPQQLTQQQREVLQFQFFDVVFSDVDRVLTMPIF